MKLKLHQLGILLTMLWAVSLAAVNAAGQNEPDDMTRFMYNVVQLKVIFADDSDQDGFGFVVGEQDYGTADKPDFRFYVVTAHHVVWQADANGKSIAVKSIQATFCKHRLDSYAGKLSQVVDPELDFAVLVVPKPFPKYEWVTQFFDPDPKVRSDAWFIGFQGACQESGVVKLNKVTYKGMSVLDNQVQPGTSGAPLISRKGIVGMITQSRQGSAEAVKIGIIKQIVEDAGVPWGLQEFNATASAQPTAVPTEEPTAKPTAKPTATPTVKPTVAPPAKPTTTPTVKPPTPTPTPEPTPTPSQERIWRDPVTGMEFVWIAGGEFLMGCGKSDKDCQDDEKPAHTVRVDGFWMGKYEVTQAQWQKVMGSNPSSFKGDNRPVESISWDNAQEFLKKLNAKNPPLPLPGGEFRLPTEAEWEYAARAGTQTAYSFGDDAGKLGDYAWYADNSGGQTHPVGQKKPNGWGLYDMHGNVWEWCQDWYDGKYYANSPEKNPPGPASGQSRLLRGGSWGSQPSGVRSADRYYDTPANHYNRFGLRLVVVGARTP